MTSCSNIMKQWMELSVQVRITFYFPRFRPKTCMPKQSMFCFMCPTLISVECFYQVFLLHYGLAKRKETNAIVKRQQYISHDDH